MAAFQINFMGVTVMSPKWDVLLLGVLIAVCGPSFAEKTQNQSALAAPEIFSVKINYTNGFIVVQGANLDPATATATIAGVNLTVDGASTGTTLLFPFSPAVSAAVSELGNYVLKLSTNGGSLSLSAFIPFALISTPPPGAACPCSTEWDQKSSTASPGGFSGLTPYCSQDSANFVTVQFYDAPASNYWVLWTSWSPADNSGFCELYLDGPHRQLKTQGQFDACAGYLRNIVTALGSQANTCLF